MTFNIQTLITVVLVILLGGAFGMNMIYLTNPDAPSSETISLKVFASIFDTIVVIFVVYQIIASRAYSDFELLISLFLLIVPLCLQLYLVFQNITIPSVYGIYAFASFNAIIRLFLLINVRCSGKNAAIPIIVQEVSRSARPASDAVKEVTGIDPQRVYANVMQTISNAFPNWRELADDEKDTIKSRIAKDVGKEPRQPREGGSRR
jgi:hypothetical protein